MKENIINFWQNHSEGFIAIGYKATLVLAIFIASAVISKSVRRAIRNTNARLKKLDDMLIPILSTTASYTVYAIASVFILDILGVNTASLIALVGAAGLSIGFALKDTLSNIAAGIMLLILRPFRTGEFIEVGTIQGTVCEVNLFTTILETVDGLYISSPNGVLWGNSVKNFTRNGKRRIDITVGISYSDPIDAGFKVLADIADSESRLLTAPAPQVMVTSMADSLVNILLRAWANNEDYWQTYWDLNKRVKESIENAGLTIPFPQRSLHLVDHNNMSISKGKSYGE